MSKMDIHGCVEAVRAHFYKSTPQASDELPVEAYALDRQLQYRICAAWNRAEKSGYPLSERECILLAEAWLISAPEYTIPIHRNPAWEPTE